MIWPSASSTALGSIVRVGECSAKGQIVVPRVRRMRPAGLSAQLIWLVRRGSAGSESQDGSEYLLFHNETVCRMRLTRLWIPRTWSELTAVRILTLRTTPVYP